ncbi:hemicentin-2-like [Aphomia sociella]
MRRQEVGEVLKFIADSVERRKTVIVSKVFTPGYGHKLEYELDSETNGSSVIISGKDPKGKVTGPDGKVSSEPLVDTSGVVVIKTSSAPGKYIADVGSKSETSVLVVAATTIEFLHGFSVLRPNSLNATSIKPIADVKSFLSIKLETENKNIELRTIRILGLDNEVILEEPVEVIDKDTNYYVTKRFSPPNSIFKIAILAYDRLTNTSITRYSLPIEPQHPELDAKPTNTAPVVTILEGSDLTAEYDEPLKLLCKVHGYPEPDIIWENLDTSIQIKSDVTVLEFPYDYIGKLEIEKVNKNETYRCKATIGINEDSKIIEVKTKRKYYFDIIKLPKDINIAYEKEGSVTCVVDAFPPPTIKWYSKGDIIQKDDKNIEISADNTILTFKRMIPNLVGKYICEVRNEFNRNVTMFNVAITGLEAPVIIKEASEINVWRRESAEILCRLARGIPTPKVTWIYIKGTIINKLDDVGEALRIKNMTPDYAGVYRCIAVNAVGRDYHDTEVIVNYPPEIREGRETIHAVEGTEPLLKCTTHGVPTPHVRWYLNENLITADKDHRIYRDNSMRIMASPDNSGIYTCVAENTHGRASRIVLVDYIVPVNIELPDKSTLETRVGRHLVLPCKADGYPKPNIKWVFYSSNPDIPPKTLEGVEGTLSLKSIQQQQDGFYTCVASNPGHSLNITYEVKVYSRPVILNAHPDKVYTTVAEDLSLRVPCQVTGNPKPIITWNLNGLPVPKGSEWYDIEEDGTLVIKNPDSNSGGFYYCKAQNKFGNDQKYFQVVVKRAPDAVSPSSSLVIKEGDTIPIKCDIPHDRVDLLRWFMNGRLIRKGELILNDARIADTGEYTCRVSNFVESSSSTTKVIVGNVPRFVNNDEILDIYLQDGTNAMDCQSEGEPAAQITWWHNGKRLEETESVYYLEMEYTDLGQYTCIVSNEFGSINRTFTISLTDCLINIAKDFEGNQPLMVTESYQLPSYNVIDDSMQIPKDEIVILSCPERFDLIPTSEIQATCVNGSNFNINGNIYKYTDLKCSTPIKPVVKHTGLRCNPGRTESIKIGYTIRERFLEVYEICLDKDRGVPIFAKNFVHWSTAGIEPKDTIWSDHKSAPYNFDALYDCNYQINGISSVLGKRFHTDDRCCFAKKQLVNSRDVAPGLPQIATYSHLNVVPHWSTCNSTNWDEVEQRVRYLGRSTSMDHKLLVWTGTSRQLELPGVISEKTPINLNDGTKEQTVPQYIWKVVQNPPSRETLAIIQVNVPDMDRRDAHKHMLCPDICHNIPWMKNKDWQDTSKGFVYCCRIRDFERAFGFKNYFSLSGDRILYGVTLVADHSLVLV